MNKSSFTENKKCIPYGGVDIKNCILSGDIDSHRGSRENTKALTIEIAAFANCILQLTST